MLPQSWLLEAQERIAPHILRTPLTYDKDLDLYIKWENRQNGGSFKLRGALTKVLSLQPWEVQRGLVAASAGNHGIGVATAGKLRLAPVAIFASEQAVPRKIQAMCDLGAEVRLVEGGYGEAEAAGKAYAALHGSIWISPYNDGQVIAGQGTLGLEILDQQPELENAIWVVPVGGGGLISGIGAAIQLRSQPDLAAPRVRLVGVQSEASPFFQTLFYHGSQQNVVELPSLADGLSGPVEEGSLTVSFVRKYVDELVLVSEDELERAISAAYHRYHEVIEGSAAVSLAAVLSGKVPDRPAVLVISGGNIQPEKHSDILARHPADRW